jgi:hypothetical protein
LRHYFVRDLVGGQAKYRIYSIEGYLSRFTSADVRETNVLHKVCLPSYVRLNHHDCARYVRTATYASCRTDIYVQTQTTIGRNSTSTPPSQPHAKIVAGALVDLQD